NTAIFSAANALLLRPLPVEDIDRFVVPVTLREGFDPFGSPFLEYAAYRDRAHCFASSGVAQAGKRSSRPTAQSERQLDANRRCREKCVLRDKARSSEVVLLCAGSPELFCREHFAHPHTGNSGRDHKCAVTRSPRARSDLGAIRRGSFARASGPTGLHSATRGHVARDFRRNG